MSKLPTKVSNKRCRSKAMVAIGLVVRFTGKITRANSGYSIILVMQSSCLLPLIILYTALKSSRRFLAPAAGDIFKLNGPTYWRFRIGKEGNFRAAFDLKNSSFSFVNSRAPEKSRAWWIYLLPPLIGPSSRAHVWALKSVKGLNKFLVYCRV